MIGLYVLLPMLALMFAGGEDGGDDETELEDLTSLTDDDLNVFFAGDAVDGTLTGTEGTDILIGADDAENIDAFEGDDAVFAAEGNDLVHGGGGIDIVDAGPGDDQVFGEEGDDLLFGAEGEDELDGGPGNDILHGGVIYENIFSFENVGEFLDDFPLDADPDTFGDADRVIEIHDDNQDTLIGGDGDDFLLLGPNDVGAGGTGGDVFEVFYDQAQVPGQQPAFITDFIPNEDLITIAIMEGNSQPVIDVVQDAEGDPANSLLIVNGDVLAVVENVQAEDVEVLQTPVTYTFA